MRRSRWTCAYFRAAEECETRHDTWYRSILIHFCYNFSLITMISMQSVVCRRKQAHNGSAHVARCGSVRTLHKHLSEHFSALCPLGTPLSLKLHATVHDIWHFYFASRKIDISYRCARALPFIIQRRSGLVIVLLIWIYLYVWRCSGRGGRSKGKKRWRKRFALR